MISTAYVDTSHTIIGSFQQCERTAGCVKFILVGGLDCLIIYGRGQVHQTPTTITLHSLLGTRIGFIAMFTLYRFRIQLLGGSSRWIFIHRRSSIIALRTA